MTIKTATGIKRFQEDKGYSAWFKHLFPLVQSRDSCQPEMAIEPSASINSDTSKSSSEPQENDQSETKNKKQFVPLKKIKKNTTDHLGEAVALLRKAIEQDPSKELINFMRDEAEKSRKHELDMANLLLNATAPVHQQQQPGNELHYWPQQQYQQAPPVFQHHQQNFPNPSFPTQGFSSPPQTHTGTSPTSPENVPKHYHTM